MFRNSHLSLPVIGRVGLPPLLDRELRAGARRPLFYWLRGLLALAAGFQGYELLDRYLLGSPLRSGWPLLAPRGPIVTGATLLYQMTWLLFLATLLMGLVAADSINRERREGTLGLLMLTGLSPGEIVRGKLLSCGLTSFLVLLGALPALMFPVLAGGVTGSQVAVTGIGLLNTLFVVLAGGLWMSARFQERRYAVAATLGLVAALAFGPELLGAAFFGRSSAPLFRLFSLTGWMTAAQAPVLLSSRAALYWFALTHALGWLFLRQAAVTLAATWQDHPREHFREPEPADEWPPRPPTVDVPGSLGATTETAAVPVRASWLTDPRPWDADPIRWRVERLGPAEGLIWLAVTLNFLAQFGTLGSLFGAGAGPTDIWGLLSFVGMAVIVFSGGLIAWTAARFFQDSRRQQDFELLLTTPLGSRNILAGQWRVLRRALTWPLGVVLLVGLPSGISLLYDLANGFHRQLWFLLQPFLISVNLALEAVALCWVGLRCGLRARNSITAVAATVGLVDLLPLVLAAGLMWGWVWLPGRSPSPALSRAGMSPVILALLFFVVKNVALIVWARVSLRRELRLRKSIKLVFAGDGH